MEHKPLQDQVAMLHEAISTYGFYDVSVGTLRTQDLLDAFALTACSLYGMIPAVVMALELGPVWKQNDRGELSSKQWADLNMSSEDLIDDLAMLLEAVAPPDYYFGTHPGDGSSFGWYEDVWLPDYIDERDL